MIERIFAKLNAIPADKVMHFASGVVLFAVLNWFSPHVAFWAVVLAATAKEVYDSFNNETHTPDPWDAFATILGGITGLVIAFSAGNLTSF